VFLLILLSHPFPTRASPSGNAFPYSLDILARLLLPSLGQFTHSAPLLFCLLLFPISFYYSSNPNHMALFFSCFLFRRTWFYFLVPLPSPSGLGSFLWTRLQPLALLSRPTQPPSLSARVSHKLVLPLFLAFPA